MIKKHEADCTLGRVTRNMCSEFFAEAISIISQLVKLDEELNALLDKESDPDDVYDALDELELKISTVTVFSSYMPAKDLARNKYLRRTVLNLQTLKENIEQLIITGRSPEEDDARILHNELFIAVGGLTYFINAEFCIFETEMQLREGKEAYDIDEVVDSYLKAAGLSVKDFCSQLCDYAKAYKYRLDLFDEYPELESKFEALLGPDYYNIPEDVLTKELVESVIDGTLSVADFLKTYIPDYEISIEMGDANGDFR